MIARQHHPPGVGEGIDQDLRTLGQRILRAGHQGGGAVIRHSGLGAPIALGPKQAEPSSRTLPPERTVDAKR